MTRTRPIPFSAFSQAVQRSGVVRVMLMALTVIALLLNGGGLMNAAGAAMPAPAPASAMEQGQTVMAFASATGDMACCDHGADSAGGKAGGVKTGLMVCPAACGGWPAQAVPLTSPVARPLRLTGHPDARLVGMAVSPAFRPPILRI